MKTPRKVTPKRQRTIERNHELTESRHAVVFVRDDNKCTFCGSPYKLHDHHALTRNAHAHEVLVTKYRFSLCEVCHANVLINTKWGSGMLILIGRERLKYEYDSEHLWYIDELERYLAEQIRVKNIVLVPAKEVALFAEKLRQKFYPDKFVEFVIVPFSQIK